MPSVNTEILNKYTEKLNKQVGINQDVFNRFSNIEAKAVNQNIIKQFSVPVTNRRLNDSQSLYQLATQLGMKDRADKILASKGEKPEEIFSGGFISDIFDALNSLQYGVVGLLKGKGFAEGVKTRQSWSDEDALGDNGLPGIIGGIALDIASDPLTYIAPWTILKKVGVLGKLKPAAKMAENTKIGQWFGRKFVYMFGADPVFRDAYEKSIKNIQITGQNISNMVRDIFDLGDDVGKKLLKLKMAEGFKAPRFVRTGLKELEGVLAPDEFNKVAKAYNKLDDLGKQAVENGLLQKQTWEENLGQYIKNAYEEYEKKRSAGLFGFKKLGIRGVKKRIEELTPEEIVKLGPIDNPSFLLFRSMIDLTKDIENAKLFKLVNDKFAVKAIQDGFKQLPDTRNLGALAEKIVPQNIFDYIQEISKPMDYGLGRKLVAGFKFGKVILNPATHARNIMSNQILNWWKLGMNPLDPRTLNVQREAASQIFKGVGNWIDEARTVGYSLDTFAVNEIKSLFEVGKTKTIIDKIGKFIPITPKVGLGKKMADLYQGEENFAKLSAFIFNRKYKNMSIENAWRAAESATFNYAQVTPFIRRLRESLFGFPFITFTYKATPIVAETALKFPRRVSVFGKIKNALENASDIKETEREKASEPAWIRDGFYIKLPMKDSEGRSAYFDLSYIIPFGDLVSGNFFTRQVKRETGIQESLAASVLEKNPVLNLIKEVSRNQDFYGDKIWKDSDSQEKQLGDLFRHIIKTYTPPLLADQLPGGYKTDLTRRQKGIIGVQTASAENQQRTLMEELLRTIGAKIQPIDADIQDTYMEWEKKKALQTLLLESGILKEFSQMYLPR